MLYCWVCTQLSMQLCTLCFCALFACCIDVSFVLQYVRIAIALGLHIILLDVYRSLSFHHYLIVVMIVDYYYYLWRFYYIIIAAFILTLACMAVVWYLLACQHPFIVVSIISTTRVLYCIAMWVVDTVLFAAFLLLVPSLLLLLHYCFELQCHCYYTWSLFTALQRALIVATLSYIITVSFVGSCTVIASLILYTCSVTLPCFHPIVLPGTIVLLV